MICLRGAKGGIKRLVVDGFFEHQVHQQKGLAVSLGLKATHTIEASRGFSGIDVERCRVDDDKKTAVVSQRGMACGDGSGDGGSRLPSFISTGALVGYLREPPKSRKSLVFQAPIAGRQPAADQDLWLRHHHPD